MPDTGSATTPAVTPAHGLERPSRNGSRGPAFDPADPRHGGLPTWTPDTAPRHLLTRRELAALGLRRGGQPVCGQLVWDGTDGITQWARLYDITQARLTRHPIRRRHATNH